MVRKEAGTSYQPANSKQDLFHPTSQPSSEPSHDEDQTGVAPSKDHKPKDNSGFLDDLTKDLPPNATPAEILTAAEQQLDDEINNREIHAETMDGRKLSKPEMDRLDSRSRHERLHDIYIAHLRATGRLDPSVQGLALFGGSPTQLRIALDYQTFTEVLGDRLQDPFQMPNRHQRVAGRAGFDSGAPRFLQGLRLSSEHLIDTVNDDGTTMIEIDRKSTRLNSSHVAISYAVFCLKNKNR